jgi:type II secretory pathway pseudopilin PulG
MHRTMHCKRRPPQAGYTLLVLVAIIALVAIGMYRGGTVYSAQNQRDRERLLLRIGRVYSQALQHYYVSSPGSFRQYPTDLKQLELDTRFVGIARHLRQQYPDPMQPAVPWGLVRNAGGGIIGVYSTSALRPFLQTADAPIAHAQHYSDWKFLAKDKQ